MRPIGRVLASLEPTVYPPKYESFKDIFEEKFGRDVLLEYRPWDYKINLKGETFMGPLYSLSAKEEGALREYIQKHEVKGYIRKSLVENLKKA